MSPTDAEAVVAASLGMTPEQLEREQARVVQRSEAST